MSISKPPDFATRNDLAEKYKVTTDVVASWEAKGLPVYGVGDLRLYDVVEVAAFFKKNRLPGRTA